MEQYQKKNTQTRFQQVALLTSAVLHHFPCWLPARGLWAGLYLPLPPGSSELPLIMQSSCNSIDPLGWSDPQIGNTLCWLTYQDIQNEWLKLFQGSRDIKIPPSFPSLLKYSQWDLAFAVTDDKKAFQSPCLIYWEEIQQVCLVCLGGWTSVVQGFQLSFCQLRCFLLLLLNLLVLQSLYINRK